MPENGRVKQLEQKIADLEKDLFEEKKARRSLENAIDTLDDGFVLFDREDRLKYANSKLKTMYPQTSYALKKGALFEELLRIGASRGEYAAAKGREEQWLAERMETRRFGNRDFDQELGDGRWIKNTDRRTKDGGTVSLRVDITNLKKAELALRKQNEYLEALHEVSLGLFERTDIESLLKLIITKAASLADTSHGFINLYDKESGTLECKYAIGRAVETVGLKLKAGEGLAGKVFMENRPIVIWDYNKWEGKLQGSIFKDMRSSVVLPLKDQTGVLGLICYDDEECEFGYFVISILRRFAELASIALQNANLNSKLDDELKQRRASDSALRASRERYRELLQAVPNAVVVYDAKGAVTFVNDAFEQTYGWNLKELSSGEIKFVPDTEIDRTKQAWQRQISDGKIRFSTRRITKNGETLEVEIHGTSIVGENGQYEGAVILHHNVTERNQAEREIKDKEKSQQAILQANPDPVVVYDERGRVTYLNPAFIKTFGWGLSELKGKTIPFVPESEKEKTLQTIKQLYKDGRPASIETKRLAKNGQILDILISAALITDTGGRSTGMVVNLTDLTAVKQLEAQLRQSQKMEAVGTLAGGIAHDFNNILHAISGYAQLLESDNSDDGTRRFYCTEIDKAVQRASDLVRGLLTFSRKVEPKLKPVDLNHEISQAVQILQHTLPRMICIETKLQEDLWGISGDATQLEQILLNLGLNAADAMPKGGNISITTQNVVLGEDATLYGKELPKGEYVKLIVADTGLGISKEALKHIFDPFFTTKEVGKGTGLGLAMVYGVVQNHNGHISCQSKPGSGTLFTIHLPRLKETVEEPVVDARQDESEMTGNETVLLVDDEESILLLGRTVLERSGYKVITANCGEDALEVFKEKRERIDLVILDLNMPGIGGERCLKGMKELDSKVKVLVASGYSSDSTANHITALGATGFLAKPFRLNELGKTVRKVLAGDKPAQ